MEKCKYKRFGTVFLAVLFCLSVLFGVSLPSFADTKDDLQTQLDALERQKQSLQQQIDSLQQDVNQYDNLRKSLEEKVSTVQKQVELVNDSINQLNLEIQNNQKAITEKQINLEQSKELLRSRLRAIYIAGTSNELAVLLSADDFGDFLARVELMRGVSDHDRALMEDIRAEIDSLNKIKLQNEQAQQEAATLKQTLSQTQNELEAEYTQASALLTELSGQQTALYNDQESLEDDIAAVQAEIEQYINEHSHSDLVFGENPSTTTTTTTTTTTVADDDTSVNRPSTSTTTTTTTTRPNTNTDQADFVWPFQTSYYISCPYGQRPTRFHTGVDISCSGALGKPIYASANGYVIKATISNVSYGNHLIIDHGRKDGKQFSTLYAHCQTLLVSVGDYVQKGQLIAYCGSTGNSTGPHLHFEIRVNGQHVDPFLYVKRP